MPGTARSHAKLRRSAEGRHWLATRPVRGKRWTHPHRYRPDHDHDRARELADVLWRLDRPDRIERLRDGHLIRLAVEQLHAFVSRLPDPTPDPPPNLAVRTFLLDGTAHVVAAPPGERVADATPCLGCGGEAVSLGRCARCQPDDPPLRDGRERNPLVLRLLSPRVDADVVSLAREATG